MLIEGSKGVESEELKTGLAEVEDNVELGGVLGVAVVRTQSSESGSRMGSGSPGAKKRVL